MSNEIKETENYSLFKLLNSNRVTGRHKQLAASLKNDGQLLPIVVNSNMEIIDGQHRFVELQALGLPVKYWITNGISVEQIPKINTTQKRWNVEDYMTFHSQRGNVNYIALGNFLRSEGLSFQVFRRIAMFGSGMRKAIQNGEMQFDLEFARKCVAQYRDILGYMPKGTANTAFESALSSIFGRKGYNHAQMMEKLPACCGDIKRSTSSPNYVRQLSHIYNYHKKDKLYFAKTSGY